MLKQCDRYVEEFFSADKLWITNNEMRKIMTDRRIQRARLWFDAQSAGGVEGSEVLDALHVDIVLGR